MNKNTRTGFMQSIILVAALATTHAMAQGSGEWVNPVIKEGGKVRPYPGSAAQPRPDKRYKVVFNITKAADSADKVNPGLEHIARLINLYALAKVPAKNLSIVAVVHGPATASILDDQHYREKQKTANPNTALIQALAKAGVTLFVCGQALAHQDLQPEWVHPDVRLALAALTVLPIYQSQGYALMPE